MEQYRQEIFYRTIEEVKEKYEINRNRAIKLIEKGAKKLKVDGVYLTKEEQIERVFDDFPIISEEYTQSLFQFYDNEQNIKFLLETIFSDKTINSLDNAIKKYFESTNKRREYYHRFKGTDEEQNPEYIDKLNKLDKESEKLFKKYSNIMDKLQFEPLRKRIDEYNIQGLYTKNKKNGKKTTFHFSLFEDIFRKLDSNCFFMSKEQIENVLDIVEKSAELRKSLKIKDVKEQILNSPHNEYYSFMQSPQLDALRGVRFSDGELIEQIDDITGELIKREITKNEVTIKDTIKHDYKLTGMDIQTHKFMNLVAMKYSHEKVKKVTLTVDDYIKSFGLKDTYESRRDARSKIDELSKNLYNYSFEFNDGQIKGETRFLQARAEEIMSKSGKRGTGRFQLLLSDIFQETIENRVYWKNYPVELIQHTSKDPLYTIIGEKLIDYQTMDGNIVKDKEDIISLHSIRKACGNNIVSNEEIEKRHLNWKQKVFDPIERTLNKLEEDNLIEWYFVNAKKEQIPDEELQSIGYQSSYDSLYVFFKCKKLNFDIEERRKALKEQAILDEQAYKKEKARNKAKKRVKKEEKQ